MAGILKQINTDDADYCAKWYVVSDGCDCNERRADQPVCDCGEGGWLLYEDALHFVRCEVGAPCTIMLVDYTGRVLRSIHMIESEVFA